MTNTRRLSAYLNSPGGKIETTILGLNEIGEVLVGWQVNEDRPSEFDFSSASAVMKAYPSMIFDTSLKDYDYFRVIGNHCECQTIAVKAIPKLSSNQSQEEWRHFQNKMPGECPCGGTRGVCPYHP